MRRAFRRSLQASMLSTVLIGATSVIVTAAPETGKAAPEFSAVDSAGKPVKLSDFTGKTVILEWTNHECPYVGKHYTTGNMQKLQKDAAAKNVVWLTVVSSAPGQQGHVDGPAADKLTQTRNASPAAVVLDPEGKVGKLYDAKTTPHMYVIAPDGKLAYNGAIDDKPTKDASDVGSAKNYVAVAIEAVASGKPVDPAVTRAYGCSVKYGS